MLANSGNPAHHQQFLKEQHTVHHGGLEEHEDFPSLSLHALLLLMAKRILANFSRSWLVLLHYFDYSLIETRS
jgi:hypothetical protein